MKVLFIVLFLIPVIALTQTAGIRFEGNLSWSEVQAKAKSENKYIFLDCYATWCGPCKMMDKKVYVNDTVGQFFNDSFISVKVQIDQTQNDNEQVKRWYPDAALIKRKYHIKEIPAFVFLSPDGELIQQDYGFKQVADFITLGEEALKPGKTYESKYADYDTLLTEYENGVKNYAKMPYMVKVALRLGDTTLVRRISKDYGAYLKNLPIDKLFTRENIEYFSSLIGSRSSFFHLFYPDGRKIDSVVGISGYAQSVVDTVIIIEEVEPFIKIDFDEMGVVGAAPKKLAEPEWKRLYSSLKRKYNSNYAKRNVLNAKIEWYRRQQKIVYTNYFVQKWKIYGFEPSTRADLTLNAVAWTIFNHVDDKKQIECAISWMKGVVERSVKVHPSWNAGTLDTYAGLLYKFGRKEEAVRLQEKAINLSVQAKDSFEDTQELRNRLDLMKNSKVSWSADVPIQ